MEHFGCKIGPQDRNLTLRVGPPLGTFGSVDPVYNCPVHIEIKDGETPTPLVSWQVSEGFLCGISILYGEDIQTVIKRLADAYLRNPDQFMK